MTAETSGGQGQDVLWSGTALFDAQWVTALRELQQDAVAHGARVCLPPALEPFPLSSSWTARAPAPPSTRPMDLVVTHIDAPAFPMLHASTGMLEKTPRAETWSDHIRAFSQQEREKDWHLFQTCLAQSSGTRPLDPDHHSNANQQGEQPPLLERIARLHPRTPILYLEDGRRGADSSGHVNHDDHALSAPVSGGGAVVDAEVQHSTHGHSIHPAKQQQQQQQQDVCPFVDAPVAVLVSGTHVFVLYEHQPHTLTQLLVHAPDLASSADQQCFITQQLLEAVAAIHALDVAIGRLDTDCIFVDKDLNVSLRPALVHTQDDHNFNTTASHPSDDHHHHHPGDGGETDAKSSLASATYRWTVGELSNFDYLMQLNAFAGRRTGDPNLHPILPWVVDFSREDGGDVLSGNDDAICWRDLSKTKYRLNKGDMQLDATFNSHLPHHISEWFTELTYFLYRARRTPRPVLCTYVRRRWEPNEYPVSMARLFAFTPDECIPEFFTDPSIFISTHADMGDLALPAWADSPEHFITVHRELLESAHVSRHLHHWIDLCFGHLLSLPAAVDAKNVHLPLAQPRTSLSGTDAPVQLFLRPHPPRLAHRTKCGGGSYHGLDRHCCNDDDNTMQALLSSDALLAPPRTPQSPQLHSHQHWDVLSLAAVVACIAHPRRIWSLRVYGHTEPAHVFGIREEAKKCLGEITPSLRHLVERVLVGAEFVPAVRFLDRVSAFPLVRLPDWVAQTLAVIKPLHVAITSDHPEQIVLRQTQAMRHLPPRGLPLVCHAITAVVSRHPKPDLARFTLVFIAGCAHAHMHVAEECLDTLFEASQQLLPTTLSGDFVSRVCQSFGATALPLIANHVALAMKTHEGGVTAAQLALFALAAAPLSILTATILQKAIAALKLRRPGAPHVLAVFLATGGRHVSEWLTSLIAQLAAESKSQQVWAAAISAVHMSVCVQPSLLTASYCRRVHESLLQPAMATTHALLIEDRMTRELSQVDATTRMHGDAVTEEGEEEQQEDEEPRAAGTPGTDSDGQSEQQEQQQQQQQQQLSSEVEAQRELLLAAARLVLTMCNAVGRDTALATLLPSVKCLLEPFLFAQGTSRRGGHRDSDTQHSGDDDDDGDDDGDGGGDDDGGEDASTGTSDNTALTVTAASNGNATASTTASTSTPATAIDRGDQERRGRATHRRRQPQTACTPQLAAGIYQQLCQRLGQHQLRATIPHHGVLEKIMYDHLDEADEAVAMLFPPPRSPQTDTKEVASNNSVRDTRARGDNNTTAHSTVAAKAHAANASNTGQDSSGSHVSGPRMVAEGRRQWRVTEDNDAVVVSTVHDDQHQQQQQQHQHQHQQQHPTAFQVAWASVPSSAHLAPPSHATAPTQPFSLHQRSPAQHTSANSSSGDPWAAKPRHDASAFTTSSPGLGHGRGHGTMLSEEHSSTNLLNVSPPPSRLYHMSSSMLSATTLDELKRIHKEEMAQLKVHYEHELKALNTAVNQLQHQLKETALEREAEMERIRAAADRTQHAMKQKYEEMLLQQRSEHLKQKEEDQRRLNEASQRHIKQLEQDFQNNQQTLALVVRELEDHIRHQDQQLQVKESQLAKKSIEVESLQAQVTALRQQTLDLQESVDKLRRENSQLNTSGRDAQTLQQQLLDLQHKHDALKTAHHEEQSRADALQEQLEAATRDHTRETHLLRENHETERGALEAEVSRLQQQAAKLHKETQRLDAEHTHLLQDHQQDIATMEERRKEALAQQRQKLARAHEHERTRLKAKITAAEKRATEAEEALSRMAAERNRQVETLRSQSAVENQNLKTKLQAEFDRQLEKIHREHVERTQKFKEEVLTARRALQGLQQRFEQERQSHAQTLASVGNQHDDELQELRAELKTSRQRAQQEVSSLQQRLRELDALRRQQLMELAAARDEEVSQMQTDHRRELDQAEQRALRLSEQLRSDMTMEVQQHRDTLVRDAEDQVRRVEDRWRSEYEKVTAQLQQAVAQLQTQQTTFSKDRQALVDRHHKEMHELRTAYNKDVEAYRQQLAQERQHIHVARDTIRKLKFEFERRLANAQLQQQDALEGYLPRDVKEQYEKTITALQQQIQLLQERLSLNPDVSTSLNHTHAS